MGTVALVFRRDSFSASCTRTAATTSGIFPISLLHAHGCDHIGNFPDFVKGEWPSNTQSSGAAIRAFRKGFWEDGGRDCAKIRENLERIVRNEEVAAANSEKGPGPSERSPGHEGEGDGSQDHPKVLMAGNYAFGLHLAIGERKTRSSWR
uniref:Uncharacterized protein n=1 Tax=Oryza meridionalis TaxID=40149 RepID=A0A0E0D2M5_9ORYZ